MHLNTKIKKILYLFFMAIGFRGLMYIAAFVIVGLSKGESIQYTVTDFLNSWARWDAVHYLNIATNGYENTSENGQHFVLVFYPMYSYLMSAMKIFIDVRIAGLFISTVMYGVGCVYLYLLVERDFSESIGKYAVILISIFPFSFFFGGIMTEGLFFGLSAAMLYYIRGHKWLEASCIGIFATMTRIHGLLLIIPAFFEVMTTYQVLESFRIRDFKKILKAFGTMCIFCLMFLGTVFYLYINWKVEGNPLQFMIYQKEHWAQTMVFPTTTLQTIWSNGTNSQTPWVMKIGLWYPELLLFVFSVLILILGRKKVSSMYLSYGIAYMWLTYSASWLLSAGRYLSVCIPIFVVLAILLDKKPNLRNIVTVTMAVFMGIYMTGFFLGMPVF